MVEATVAYVLVREIFEEVGVVGAIGTTIVVVRVLCLLVVMMRVSHFF